MAKKKSRRKEKKEEGLLSWGSFVKAKHGEWDGLNNAAIYTFSSNIINSLVREMLQNSIDARNKELPKDPTTGKLPPLRVRIAFVELPKSNFPDYDKFKHIFTKIAKANKEHVKFFENGFAALGDRGNITLFAYEDFNTTGLEGADDDKNMSFNACVVSEAVSVKSDATAGGSFGIGKNAIYGLSKTRTVFYTSMNPAGEYIFQGKAKLASYYDSGKTHDNKVYCGMGTSYSSVRNIKKMPKPYRSLFNRTEAGLSQFAVCPVEHEEWPKEFTRAVIRNYWMLLEKGELEVSLVKQSDVIQTIGKANLGALLEEFFNPATFENEDVKPEGNPYEFHKCYLEGKHIEENHPQLGKVHFYYMETENDSTNTVAYLRNDMVVYTKKPYGFGNINYAGVLFCEDPKGNTLLRAMEPPTHDSFDAERLDDKMLGFSRKDGDRILASLKTLVKNALQEIADKYTKASQDIPWLNDFFPSMQGVAGSAGGNRSNTPETRETTERMGRDFDTSLLFSTQKRNVAVNNPEGTIPGTGSGSGGGTGGGGIGDSGGAGKGTGGGASGSRPSTKSKIRSRIFRTEESKTIEGRVFTAYRIVLGCEQPIAGAELLVSQHGDSGNVAMFEIGQVQDDQGKSLEFESVKDSKADVIAYRVKSVAVPSKIKIYVNEPYKSSFAIVKG